ncbi:MAG: hypothetical protein L0H53_00595 [Candidatus Nitrosocosmicus sp.]|nr:hypothetical protein [Candidatus Nitrosocosmicus sp.]MDN5866035.1 hypothetical protein [Candidatus Nitrosocosmicus sp.]
MKSRKKEEVAIPVKELYIHALDEYDQKEKGCNYYYYTSKQKNKDKVFYTNNPIGEAVHKYLPTKITISTLYNDVQMLALHANCLVAEGYEFYCKPEKWDNGSCNIFGHCMTFRISDKNKKILTKKILQREKTRDKDLLDDDYD